MSLERAAPYRDTGRVEPRTATIHRTRIVVRGVVQGVGFRWYVRREAARLGLAGYARNLPDGSVEVVARGGETELGALEGVLRCGPPSSEVSAVETIDVPHDIHLPNSFDAM